MLFELFYHFPITFFPFSFLKPCFVFEIKNFFASGPRGPADKQKFHPLSLIYNGVPHIRNINLRNTDPDFQHDTSSDKKLARSENPVSYSKNEIYINKFEKHNQTL